jgi:tetratricopeptide (TPR) repeat protein
MNRIRLPAVLILLALAVSPARGDGLQLADGRMLSGRVVEKPDAYEVTVDGQTLTFAKEDVKRWVKSPKDVIGDADQQFEEAKKIFQEALQIADGKAAETRFRDALPKVQKARDAYAEARDLFPGGYPEIDAQLVNIMKLMRMVRDRMGSQFAGSAAPPTVNAKDAPAPVRPSVKVAPAPAPEPAPAAASTIAQAFAVLVDPAKRTDAARRRSAREAFAKVAAAPGPLRDLATAARILLSREEEEWGLCLDVVTVQGAGIAGTYEGRLDPRSETISVLLMADGRELRLRKEADGVYVTPPAGKESKATECRIEADRPGPALAAFQSAFAGLEPAALEAVGDGLASGVVSLARATKELRGKADVEPLQLLAAGMASSLVARNGGEPVPALEPAFKDLGFEKSDAGSVWGDKASLAMDDYRKWIQAGEYGLAIVQFHNDYRSVQDLRVHYAMGLLYLFRALAENRNYTKAAGHFEGASRSIQGAAKDHFLAMAKSIRAESPCASCGGTHKINCSACKGKGKVNFLCGGCGGSGKVNTFNGVKACKVCAGKGRYVNEPCPKCKTTGKADCKARGCDRPVPKPTFESFAEAYKCQSCRGQGSLLKHVALSCDDCSGVGLILQPKADPAKLLN